MELILVPSKIQNRSCNNYRSSMVCEPSNVVCRYTMYTMARHRSNISDHIIKHQHCRLHIYGGVPRNIAWTINCTEPGNAQLLYSQLWMSRTNLHIKMPSYHHYKFHCAKPIVNPNSCHEPRCLCNRILISVRRHFFIETTPWWQGVSKTSAITTWRQAGAILMYFIILQQQMFTDHKLNTSLH